MSIGKRHKYKNGLEHFAQVVRWKRTDAGYGLREAARRIGILHSTLHRVESAKMMDVKSFALICMYYKLKTELWLSVIASGEK